MAPIPVRRRVPGAVERIEALIRHLELRLDRVGEAAARPPLVLEAMRSPPPLARERREWLRPARALSGWVLLEKWRRLAEEGGPMAGAAKIRVAMLEEQKAAALAARAEAEGGPVE